MSKFLDYLANLPPSSGDFTFTWDGTLINMEKDPNGIEAGKPGAKFDAGKVAVTRGALHYFPRAIRGVASLSGVGAKKYSWKGWQEVSDGVHRYGDALGRHELSIEDDFTKRDPDTGELEVVAVAWNALARAELVLRALEKGQDVNKSG